MTKREALIVLQVLDSFLELIKAKGEMGQPLGELYAHVMGKMSLEAFNKLIDLLMTANRITVSNHCAYYNQAVRKQ